METYLCACLQRNLVFPLNAWWYPAQPIRAEWASCLPTHTCSTNVKEFFSFVNSFLFVFTVSQKQPFWCLKICQLLSRTLQISKYYCCLLLNCLLKLSAWNTWENGFFWRCLLSYACRVTATVKGLETTHCRKGVLKTTRCVIMQLKSLDSWPSKADKYSMPLIQPDISNM